MPASTIAGQGPGSAEPPSRTRRPASLAQLPQPVAIYDREARFVGANELMIQALGTSQEEMRGLTLWEIEPHPPFDEIDRLQRQVLSGSGGQGRIRHVSADQTLGV
ncbi:PAS domain-containing protein [Streptomyces sp. NPDC003758]